MALIKKSQLEQKGTIVVEKDGPTIAAAPKPAFVQPPAPQISPAAEAAKARTEADKIIQQAKGEAGSIKDKAYADGKASGQAEASNKIEEALQTLNDAVIEKEKIIKDAEPEILRLAIKVAEQIIHSEVSLHRDVCLNIVAEAIARVSDREQIIVRVNREDAEFLKRYKDRLAAILDGVKSFSILEDQSIEPGGCVIETNLGFIDSKISTKLKSIEDALNKESASIKQEETLSSDDDSF